MSIRKLMRLGVVAAVSAAMFGCGGGGGGEYQPPPPSPSTTVQGAGVDDYIIGGTVKAWRLKDGMEVTLKGPNGTICKTGPYGIFNCTAENVTEDMPLLFAIKGGKLDDDGLPGGNQTDYKGALLAFAIPKEPVIVSPVTTKVVSEVLDIEPVVTENETHVSEASLTAIDDKIGFRGIDIPLFIFSTLREFVNLPGLITSTRL